MAKIRKWLVYTSVGQDVYLAQNQKAISVLFSSFFGWCLMWTSGIGLWDQEKAVSQLLPPSAHFHIPGPTAACSAAAAES